jgi:hypothetical protein
MSGQTGSLEDFKARMASWLVAYKRLPEAVTILGDDVGLPDQYTKAFQRVEGWFRRFKTALRGDPDAFRRLDQLVSKASDHPSKVGQHQISICIQDLMVGNLQLVDGSSEPDGPVGGESSGIWRHAGKVVGGLGTGKAFQVFYEAHSSGMGSRIACEKFDIGPKIAVRGVTKIIDRIEREAQAAFEWQLQEAVPYHVLVVPRKKPRPDKGAKQGSPAASLIQKNPSAKAGGKASKPKSGRPKR